MQPERQSRVPPAAGRPVAPPRAEKDGDVEVRRRREAAYWELLSQIPDGIVVVDADSGLILGCNPSFVAMSGRPLQRLCELHIWDLRPPDKVESARRMFFEIKQTGNGGADNLELQKPDGTIVPIEFLARLTRHGDRPVVQSVVRDISERRRSEQSIREAKTFLDTVVDWSPFAMWVSDPKGTVIRTNRVLRETLNLTDDQIIGQYNVLRDRNLDEQGVMPLVAAVFEKHEHARFRIPWRAAGADGVDFSGGRDLFIDVAMFPILDAEGELRHVVCQWVDITELKQAEDALRGSERNYREMAGNIPGMVHRSDSSWRPIVMSGAEEICGYRSGEFLAGDVSWIDLIHPDDRPAVLAEAERIEREPLSITQEYRITARDGSVRWVEDNKSSRFTPEGVFDGVDGVVLDISARKQTEHALKGTEAKFRGITDSIGIGVALISPEMKILELNRQMREWFPDIEVERHPSCYRAFRRDQHEVCSDCPVAQTVGDGRMHEGTTQSQQGGVARIHRVVSSPLLDEHGKVTAVLEMVEDVTDSLAIQGQLRQSQRLESIGTLAGGVAHEINNPIMGIMNYAQLIMERLATEDESTREFAEEIIHEGERVATIVRSLLQFARNERRGQSPACMCDIAEGTLSLVRAVLRHDQVTLETDVPERLPKIRCHSQQIQQVVMNLITNARDALNEKYPGHDENKKMSISAREIDMSSAGDANRARAIRLTVEDHGAGIPENVRERLFDPFFTTKPRDKGTGLGLSISHGIVKDHGGELTVESEAGEWTRFHVDLPVDGNDEHWGNGL